MGDERAGGPADLLPPSLTGTLRVPVSTYRLQLHRGFTFSDVLAIVDYLQALGIGACYLSPCLTAQSGSTHGYDVVDHGTINPELGGREGFEALARELRRRGMGLVLDVVPNHMRADPVENRHWWDVLENGPSALSAGWFDVDWRPASGALHDKVLLAILGDQYGAALERGEIRVTLGGARLDLRYFDHRLPLNPQQLPLVFDPSLGELERSGASEDHQRELRSILTAFGNLPAYTERDAERREERRRETGVTYERFERLLAEAPAIAAFVEHAVAVINGRPGDPASFDALHGLLERQAYRLAYWRTAFDEINYRRFFDINELVAVRMEDPRVFDKAHQLILELVGDGLVTGLRLDHPDGLADPEAYFERLQEAAWRASAVAELGDAQSGLVDAFTAWRRAVRAADPSHWVVRPLYVVAEKIVTAGEGFPPGWAIHGGTGYQFLNHVTGLSVDRGGLHQIERLWSRLTGRTTAFDEIAYECRRLIAQTSMASEMNVLAHWLERMASDDRRTRDFTLNNLRKVLREVVACFPVYRTYVSERGVSETDREVVRRAVHEARRRSPVMEPSIFDFVEQALLPVSGAPGYGQRLAFAIKVQQLTGPVQAKGLEDTAFYRHCALLAVNEVGSHPADPCVTVEDFHQTARARLADWPDTMLALATHDTKRGADARARLAALSERPDEWRRHVAAWMRINARRRPAHQPDAPDKATEYHLYQALLAIWPAVAADAPMPSVAPAGIATRVADYMVKAVREAKERSSWLRPDEAYEEALVGFVHEILEGLGARRFLPRFVPFARTLARHGAMTSLTHVVLEIASPGVPDIYQGSELWHLHLVDPDNRGPVDFTARREILDALLPWLDRAAGEGPDDPGVSAFAAALADGWMDGRIKAWVTAAALRHRRADPDLFLKGAYVPLVADAADAPVVAFARVLAGRAAFVAAPRLAGRLTKDGEWPRGAAWGEAALIVPPELAAARWRDRLTGRIVEPVDGPDGARLPLASLFAVLPVCWMSAIAAD